MLPYIEIGNVIRIPTYGLTFVVGFLLAAFLCIRFAKRLGRNTDETLFAALFAVVGIGVGAKLFYVLTFVPQIIRHPVHFWNALNNAPFQVLNLIFGGLVFYGGLIGGALAIYVYCKVKKIDANAQFMIMVPYFPLIHAFGRVGCFLAGCCYGVEYHGIFAVTFPEGSHCPGTRFPTQLCEVFVNLLIFVVLILLRKYKTKDGLTLTTVYTLSYATARFFIEFMRGDEIRGVFGPFSTSQYISLALIITFSAVAFFRLRRKSRTEKAA